MTRRGGRRTIRGAAWAGAALLAALLAAPAAAEPARHPPYPDLWGRVLPMPAGAVPAGLHYFPTEDGDRLVAFSYRMAGAPYTQPAEFRALTFFGGALRASSYPELKALWARFPKPSSIDRTPLPDGTALALVPLDEDTHGPLACALDHYSVRRAADGRALWRKLVVRRLAPPAVRPLESTACYRYAYRLPTLVARVDIQTFFAWPDQVLADGTFLAHLQEELGARTKREVIRFDADLRSPFVEASPDLVVLDWAEVEPLLAEATAWGKAAEGRFGLQRFHDALAALVDARLAARLAARRAR